MFPPCDFHHGFVLLSDPARQEKASSAHFPPILKAVAVFFSGYK